MQRRLSIQAGLCLVGCLHLIAFTSLLVQYPPLFGRHGVQPISSALRAADNALQEAAASCPTPAALARWAKTPSLLWLHSSVGLTAEAMFALLCGAGFVLAAAAACGVTHPVVFTALWALYLSFVNVGGAFLEAGDDILLEVTFAAILLAAGLQASRRRLTEQWQEYQLEHLSTPVLMLLKWVLFKLLLISSTFSASMVCATAPGLVDCYRALAVHGLPTVLTRGLVNLPGPVAFAATVVLMLELPAAFLLLCVLPSVQRAVGRFLLALQLARVALGPASLTNLATAGLCVLATNNGSWIPHLAGLAARLGWGAEGAKPGSSAHAKPNSSSSGPQGGEKGEDEAGKPSDELFAILDCQPPPRRTGSNCSITSLFMFEDEELLEAEQPPAGRMHALWRRLQQVPLRVSASIAAAFLAVLVGWTADGHWVLRFELLTRGLHYCVPFAMAWFAAALLHQSWRSVAKVLLKARRDARTIAARAAPGWGTLSVGTDIANLADVQSPPGTPKSPATEGRVAKAARRQQATPGTAPPALNGRANGVAEAAQQAEAADEGKPADGEDGVDGAAAAAAAGAGGSPSKSKAAGRAARGRGQGKAAAKAGKGGRQRQAPAGDGEEPGAAGTSAAAAGAAPGSKAAAGTPAAAAAAAAAAPPPSGAGTTPGAASTPAGARATPGAGAAPTAAALAAKAARPAPRGSGVATWSSVALAGATTLVVLGVFVAGAPAVWQAGGQRMSTLSLVPALPRAYEYARYWGVVSGTGKARAAFRASAVAAATQPGSVLAYEVYATGGAGAPEQGWQRVGFRTVVQQQQQEHGATAAAGGLLAQLRGLYEPRLQAKMAAAGARDARDKEWLASLTNKIVQGAPQLASVLQQPPQPRAWATLHEATFLPGGSGWEVAADSSVEVVKPVSPDSLQFKAASGAMEAEPGDDGWLVAAMEQALSQLQPTAVLAVLLLAVALRHLLLPGGLLDLCAGAVARQAAPAAPPQAAAQQ